jgi:hypothetical protein
MFVTGRPFQPNLMFEGKARSLPRWDLPILTNIRLGWKGLQRTNTLAYYEHSKITAVKGLTILGSGFDLITTF